MKRLPVSCPSCGGALAVKRLRCETCSTEVEGLYDLPILAGLSNEDQDFLLQFVKTSGSLKDMAQHLGVSYPTVRNRLDDIIETLKKNETQRKGSGRDK
jgi:hypothetical protein